MTLAQRIEALLERLASQSWCDTAHHIEARALLVLLREEIKDAR